MIRILVHNTHMKFYFQNMNSENKKLADSILNTRFRVQNTALNHDYRVKSGQMSNIENFYNNDHHMLPTGFIKPLLKYFDELKIQYELDDKRLYPKPDINFLKQLKNGKVEVGLNPRSNKPFIPREHQIETILTCVKEKSGVVWAPMAFGKSFCMYLLTKVFPNTKILIMFPGVDILMQTYKVFVEEYKCDPNEIGIIQGNNIDDTQRITLLSMFSYQKAFHLFNDIRLAIMDEIHESSTNDTAEAALFSMQKCSMRFGFSATPKHDNPYRSMKVFANIGPIIYRKKIKEQIDIGTLVKTHVTIFSYSCNNIPVIRSYADIYETLSINKKRSEEDLIKAGFEILEKNGNKYGRKFIQEGNETTHYINNEVRNKIIAEIADNRSKKGERILILFSKIRHGEILQSLIKNKSILIHGVHNKDEKQEAEMFLRNNKGAIVLASSIWNTGIDIEEISTYINAAGGVSTQEVIQKMGRIVRNSNTTDKPYAEAIDFDDACLSPLGRKQSLHRIEIYENEELPIKYETYIEGDI